MTELNNPDAKDKTKTKDNERAKKFYQKIKDGYIPENRLKNEIVNKLFKDLTGSKEDMTYDDLMELHNNISNTDFTHPDDQESQKPEKTEINLTKSHPDRKKPINRDRPDDTLNDIPDKEEENIFTHDFGKVGSFDFHPDHTVTNGEGLIVGMWNQDGKVKDPNGKQVLHLPGSKAKDFNTWMDVIGEEYSHLFGLFTITHNKKPVKEDSD